MKFFGLVLRNMLQSELFHAREGFLFHCNEKLRDHCYKNEYRKL